MAHNASTISSTSAFSDNEIQSFKVYFEFLEKYNVKINETLILELVDHDLWGPIIKSQTPKEQKAQNDRSLELQRAAIYEGKWEEYRSDLKMQGHTYAQMNISYKDWHEIIKMYKDLLVPFIKTDPDYSKEKSILLMDGLSKFTDFALSIIAESYFEERINFQKSNDELQELMSFIINSTEDAVFSKDLNGLIISWNPSAEKMFGYVATEIIGKPGSILLPDKGINEDVQILERVKKGESIVHLESVRLKKDGTAMSASISVSPIKNLTGEVIGVSKIVRDITEQKRTLQERNIFFEHSIDMICTAGFDGYFKSVNPAVFKTLGFTNEEMHEKPFLDLIHPSDVDKTLKEMERLDQGHITLSFVNRYRCKNGDYKWFQWNAVKVGELMYCIARDITEQKVAEEKIKALNDNLEETVRNRTLQLELTNKELESFSYSVSHDLRAPLRAINGFSKILKEDYCSKLDAEGIRTIDIIMNNSKKMGILIDDLLAFSRLGRKELTTSEINMTALVKSVKEEEVEGNSNKIEFFISALPPTRGDQALIKQVWVNLISNAIKYSKHKPISNIEIGSYCEDDEIVYFVKDNGVGFDMQYYDKLFGVFQRLHSSEEFEGTGVGLAIIQRIIHRHKGKIWAESKLNEETCFYFSLPNLKS